MRTYEGLFLVDPTIAAREWNRIGEELERILKRNSASVVSYNKWGERKLAYPVRKNNRGTYVLAYFSAQEKSVPKIRADFHLSEIVLRSIIVRHEGELRKEPPRDFETAGFLPPKREPTGEGAAGDDRPRFDRPKF